MTAKQTEKQFLKSYNIHDFDVPLTSVDMAIFTLKDEQLQVLLVKRAQHPALGQWALPGGFIDFKKDKVLADAARRKLAEKTGVDTPYLEQVATFGGADRDPRGWSVTITYFALIVCDEVELSGDESSDDVKWVPIKDITNKLELAFDHKQVLAACIERLKNKVQYTSLPVNLLPEEFTLTELQQTFEIILDKKIEKKSFRRRIDDADILEETGNMKTGSNRPAKLYRAKPKGENFYFTRNIEGPR
ncbi:NUDIX hydrolase [Dasania sp. GY-MA-18]|uniref:NUDIX hydrolase n=1 Tax=Dasania phycosphaerae TaxID=2950436 RepID=A0A9J6RK90_9GAMM|nr:MULTISPECIES: NUDIX hydrolase [Dasania]MCR8922341.1 NUDIX hydrolase [Dasania sp. GY-MA-18]MCZ0864769.1 NUDIX hydrolase [Dasania phycosphaerae]MCZ0868497.1 NUDIX hydrolase [Dasania phycosphaerae]